MTSSVTVSIIEPPIYGSVRMQDPMVALHIYRMMRWLRWMVYVLRRIHQKGIVTQRLSYIYQTIVTSIDQSHFYIDENCNGNTIFFENNTQNPCEKMILRYSKDRSF